MSNVVYHENHKTFPVKLTPELTEEYERVRPLLIEDLRNAGSFTLTMVNVGRDENDNEPTIQIGVSDMKRSPDIFSKTYIPIHVHEIKMWGSFARFNDGD